MAMPIASIPEFKKEGALLKISCQTGNKQLSKVTYPCEKVADLDADKQGIFFWEENAIIRDPEDNSQSVKPSKAKKKLKLHPALISINWLSSVISFLFLGISPCFTTFLDTFSILIVIRIFQLPYSNFFRVPKAILTLAITIFDANHCWYSLENDSLWDLDNSKIREILIWFIIVPAVLIVIVGLGSSESESSNVALQYSVEPPWQSTDITLSQSSIYDRIYIYAPILDFFLYICFESNKYS